MPQLIIFLLAEPAADLLGENYDGLVLALIVLTPLPALRTIRTFLSDGLSESGNEQFVTRTCLHAFALHVLLALPLVAIFGWLGAIIANAVSECANVSVLWTGHHAITSGRRPHHQPTSGLQPVPRTTALSLPAVVNRRGVRRPRTR